MAELRAELTAATARLASAGVGSPQVDAELLLAAVLGTSRSLLALTPALTDTQAQAFNALLDRRASREPLQHILGLAPFRFLELEVGPGVFVPRPETELLVDAVMPVLTARPNPLVVDLCAGSGALGLAVAQEVPGAEVIAVELDPQALIWLRRNAANLAAQHDAAISVLAGDVCDPDLLSAESGRVDVVLSNPPYVPGGIVVDPEVAADPALAVFAGPDGLDLIGSVLEKAAMLLKSGGALAMEHDDTQGESVPALLRADGRWDDVRLHHDLTGRPRFCTSTRAAR